MRAEDHQQLLRLWSSFPGNTITGADSDREFRKFLQRNRGFCFTACDGNEVVGSVMAGSDRRRGYIYHLAVCADLQGRGLGSALMKKAEEALAKAGLEKAHLFIYRDNPAVVFYEKAGWHAREDITLMSKALGGDSEKGTIDSTRSIT